MKRTWLGGVAISALLLAAPLSSAGAADLAYKAPTPPPPPAWSWTGFYIGLQGGAGWGTVEDQVSSVQSCIGGVCGPQIPVGFLQSSFDMSGMFGGATAGFNWQTGPVVLGVEGDFSGSNISGNSDCSHSFGLGAMGGTSSTCKTEMNWFGTATGRVGLTADHALLYIKAGAAWAHFDHNAAIGTVLGGATLLSGTVSDTPVGFTFGTGLEYALWGGWSAKVEYDFMDFGNKQIVMPLASPIIAGGVVNETDKDHIKVNIVRAGVNYRFNLGGAL